MATERNVVDFKIHNLTEEQFQELKAQGKIDPNAVYCTPDESLNRNHITNCITEIPQDIKLELTGGTLTLKAGSTVYVPKGAGVFNKKTTTTDVTTQNLSGYQNGKYLVFDNSDFSGTSLRCNLISDCYSGATAPATGTVWYDTTNNKIMVASSGTWTGNRTLPLGVITISNGTISSIDQVFNGFGYIGSTIFALPGIKGLIPNGRNDDGTLKNIVVNNTSVKTVTKTTAYSAFIAVADNGAPDGYSALNYYPEQNMILSSTGAQVKRFNAGTVIFGTNGQITSFEPKPAFHAVDYSDFENTVEKLDNSVVHKTGDETILNIKSFSGLRLRNDVPNSKDITTNTETTLAQTTLNTAGGIDGASIIRYVLANGDREVRYRAGFLRRNSSGNIWPGIRVGADINDNKYYRLDENPASTSNGTDIATTAWVRDLFETLYPVGSLYITSTNATTCPLASIVKKSDGTNSTWSLVSSGKALWTGTGSNGNTTIAAGLPNITGDIIPTSAYSGVVATGAFYGTERSASTITSGGSGAVAGDRTIVGMSASRSSSVYGNSTTVQPPAYVVNVWRRTA